MKFGMLLGLGLLVSLVFLGCLSSEKEGAGIKAVVYKTTTCGCCGEYANYLRLRGFDVEVVNMASLAGIKQQYGIPGNMESCHTSVIDGYFVEGHMPVEAIDRLLAERPPIDGIALPGMPSGSPGMPGLKTQPFTIHTIDQGAGTGNWILD